VTGADVAGAILDLAAALDHAARHRQGAGR
jgi:hypothetical protein